MALKIFICVALGILGMTLEVQSASTAVTVADACPLVAASKSAIYCDNKNQCLSKSAIVCVKTGVGFPVKCPADKPYCKFSASAVVNSINIGECSADLPTKQFLVAGAADVDCTSSNDQFVCMQVGFQPNPDNCQKYYYCSTDGVKFTPLGLSCKADKMYNPLTTSCDLLYSPAKCVKIDCTAVKLFSQIPYGTSKQNFAVCAEGPEKEPVPLMFACPDNTVANLTNAFLDVCVYTCVKIGFFPHTLADNLYFECSFENNVWKSKLGICPTAKIFKENKTNPTSFSCA